MLSAKLTVLYQNEKSIKKVTLRAQITILYGGGGVFETTKKALMRLLSLNCLLGYFTSSPAACLSA